VNAVSKLTSKPVPLVEDIAHGVHANGFAAIGKARSNGSGDDSLCYGKQSAIELSHYRGVNHF
jgi:hypothetical protein